MDILPLSLLGFGFLLGVRHALEADHIAAVSTVISMHNSIKKSSLLGMFWGFGHSIALFIVGLAVLLLKIKIPEKISLLAELIVGIMLVILGINVLLMINENRIHMHKHKHEDIEHVHFHSHKSIRHHQHKHIPIKKSLLIGLIHGLAGSAALTLLILTAIDSALLGLMYILIFGLGSILGMAIVSSIISLPFKLIPNKLEKTQKMLRLSTSLFSIIIGLFVIIWTAS